MVARWANQDPVDWFNRAFGRPAGSGRPVNTYTDRYVNRGQTVRDVARGSPRIRASTTRAYNQGRTARRGVGNPRLQVSDSLNNMYNKLLENYNDTAQQEIAISRANEAQIAKEEEERGLLESVLIGSTGGFLGATRPQDGFGESPVGRVLDIVSRPSYALAEGLKSLAEIPESGQGWNPGDLFGAVQEFGSGLGRGLTGEDKTGFGEVYEAYKNNPDTALGPGLQTLEEEHPNWEQALAIGAGAAGEIFLDPTNFVMPAAPNILRETGEIATEATIRKYLTNAAGKVVEDAINANPSLIPSHMTPDTYVQAMMNQTDELISRSILETSGGSRSTKLLNNDLFSQVFGNNVSAELQEKILGVFNNVVDDFVKRAPQGRFTEAAVQAWRQNNDNFDNFFARLADDAANDGLIPYGATDAEILKAIENGVISPGRVNKARNAIVGTYEGEFAQLTSDLVAKARNPTYRTMGIRVGNKVVPAKTIGKAFNWAGGGGNDAARILGRSFEKMFPGLLAGKTGAARALGFGEAEKFQKVLRDFIRQHGFTPAEAEELDKLRAAGTRTINDPRMQAGLDFLDKHYNDLWDEQISEGARGANALKGDNYTFIYNRKGSGDARRAFKEGRKTAIHDPNIVGPGSYTKAEAAARGLNPTKSSFENLWQYYIKTRRDMTRAYFHQDIVDNYGLHIRNKLSEGTLNARGLSRVAPEKLNDAFRNIIRKEGGEFYVPTGMQNVIDNFNDITSWTPKDFGALGRSYQKIMNMIKTGLTLPYPGFHIRNLIGDVFMGLMDDINPRAYQQMITKYTLDAAGRRSIFKFFPGFEKTYKEMKELFEKNADAGFVNSDLGTYESLTAGSIPKTLGRRTVGGLRKGSDIREGFGRFVHFTEAFRQEAKALADKGITDADEITRRATEAAVWRVNHFKFDYQALSVFEKQLKTYAFPFYTYMRKAVPTLMEQMFMNPHYMSTANRFMEYNDGTDADLFNSMNIPQYIKDMGFGVFGDEEEPFALTADVLPFGALEVLTKMGDPQEFSRELVSNLNPFARAPIEQAFR